MKPSRLPIQIVVFALLLGFAALVATCPGQVTRGYNPLPGGKIRDSETGRVYGSYAEYDRGWRGTTQPVVKRKIDNDQAKRATWKVKVSQGGGVSNVGSGTAIGPHYVLTNRHVVERGTRAIISRPDVGQQHEGRVVAVSRKNDLAVIYVEATLAHVTIADENPKSNSQVFVLGYAGSQGYLRGDYTRFKGISATGVGNSRNMRTAYFTAMTVPGGFSGGGLFNEAGELVGVTWGSTEIDCAAVPLPAVTAWLTGYI